MKVVRTLTLAALLLCLPSLLWAQQKVQNENILDKIAREGDFAPMFPFQPTHDAPANITNVKTWKGTVQGQAGDQGFITAKDGVFVDGEGNLRRFLGTNICFTGCFPDKKDAERVASELARYGINVVRLHYCHHKFPAGKEYPEQDSFLEPEQLDRFDYLLAQLKKNGIYTYFQLNIARKFGEQNGFENASKLPWYNNGIDNVDFNMIELQKRFHYEILNHKNPYTGLQYKNEPAISMLELSNENSIMHAWFGAKYNFPHLTEPYATRIKDMWNKWLFNKYLDTKTLKEAWTGGLKGDGTEFIPDGIMDATAYRKWKIANDKISKAVVEMKPAEKKDKLTGSHYASVNVTKAGQVNTQPMFFRAGIKVKSMEPYCLKFKARSDRRTEIGVRASQLGGSYKVVGLQTTVSVGPKWKEYSLNFCANMDFDNVRIVFTNFVPGTYDFADVSLVSGMEIKWDKTRSIEEGNIDWPYKENWSEIPQRAYDFVEFLSTLEQSYFTELYSNTKFKLKAKQPIAGTQLHYGFNLPQSDMDYVDYHNYWNHPSFGGRSFNYTNWKLGAGALVNGSGFNGSSLATIARSRIFGRPFTISEYDHPNTNLYSAEGNLMCSAMGAFQNWSGILQFAWTHNQDFFRDVLNQSFDMCSATQKLVHLPACYSMFVRGDVAAGDIDTVFCMTSENKAERELMTKVQNPWCLARQDSKLLATMPLSLVSGKQVVERPKLFSEGGKTVVRTEEQVPESIKSAYADKEMKSSTGELTWNWKNPQAGYFIADSPLTKVFTGFVRGREFRFSGMTLIPGKTRLDWLTLSLTCTNPGASAPKDRLGSGSYLLAVTGLVHNTDAVYVSNGKNLITSGVDNGGNPGKAPILCEGIPAVLSLDSLAGKVECYALDPAGERCGKVEVKTGDNGEALVCIGPRYKTVWYELVIL